MNPNPFNTLLHSRKFWIATLDAVVSTVLLLATRFLSPADVDFVKQVVAIYQPVFLVLIGSIAWEDTTRIKANARTYPVERAHTGEGEDRGESVSVHE